MKLAGKITLDVSHEPVDLRPTLRHALRLSRRPGDFRQLIADINDGSLTAAVDIIAPHCDRDSLQRLNGYVLTYLPKLKPYLLAYVFGCMGIDPDVPETKAKTKLGKPRPYEAYLTDLFKLGTGWLDWSPEQTLDATPLEIALAYEGKRDMLRAIYGGGEKPKDNRSIEEKTRGIFAGLDVVKVEAVQPVAPEVA